MITMGIDEDLWIEPGKYFLDHNEEKFLVDVNPSFCEIRASPCVDLGLELRVLLPSLSFGGSFHENGLDQSNQWVIENLRWCISIESNVPMDGETDPSSRFLIGIRRLFTSSY